MRSSAAPVFTSLAMSIAHAFVESEDEGAGPPGLASDASAHVVVPKPPCHGRAKQQNKCEICGELGAKVTNSRSVCKQILVKIHHMKVVVCYNA